MTHLTEEQLNLYLDGALLPQEQATVEAHLTGCTICQTDLESLQTLFVALDALQPDPLMSDLTSIVLSDVATTRQRAYRRRRLAWGILGLQALTIIVLLLFGWAILSKQFIELSQVVPSTALTAIWANLSTQGNLFWHTVVAQWQLWLVQMTSEILSLPVKLKPAGDFWPKFAGWSLPASQVAIVGLAALLMWLVGNSIILRTVTTRPIPGRQPKH
jgi:predicted anti-sigma-YlaC factor YlaD